MIKRIVMMQFKPSSLPLFFKLFEQSKYKIRNFPGCQHLEMWQDKANPERIFTYSFWDSENDLNLYRSSPLFKSTWSKTKILFDAPPQAWSVEVLSES